MDLSVLSRIKVLIVEDDEDDFLILKRMFSNIQNATFEIDRSSNYDEALKQIQLKKHDVYLIDYRLGEKTGLDLLKDGHAEKRSVPFILLTGAGDPEVEWRSMRLAASDFLVKDKLSSDVLSRAIYYALERKKIEKQRVQELIDLNRNKDEFISIASHQLRTPATAVKQYIGMVIEGLVGDVPEQQLKLLKRAYVSNDRQLAIVTDLLRVAQIDSGQVTLQKESVDLGELIQEVITDLSSTFKKRNQQISFKSDQSMPAASIDRKAFRMVLENLIDNASKYSVDGKKIAVGLTHNDRGFEIAVADQGVGIDPAQFKQLFEKFSRIPNELSTVRGGTGLGLYWAKQIVDLHQGTIKVTNNEREGTTFTVSLPK